MNNNQKSDWELELLERVFENRLLKESACTQLKSEYKVELGRHLCLILLTGKNEDSWLDCSTFNSE